MRVATALAEVSGKSLAAVLIGEGAAPRLAADVTGTPLHFAQRLSRELRPKGRGERLSVDAHTRLWGTRTRLLHSSLFGLCLAGVRRGSPEPASVALVVEAYRLFHLLRAAVVAGNTRFSAFEAVLFYQEHLNGMVELAACPHCGSRHYVPRIKREVKCPACQVAPLVAEQGG